MSNQEPELTFEIGRVAGSQTVGFRRHWVFSRHIGVASPCQLYVEGSGFLTVHWEVQHREDDDHRNGHCGIRFHIEAPRSETDKRLNELKLEILAQLDSAAMRERLCGLAHRQKWTIDFTRRRGHPGGTKSTEVFRVMLPADQCSGGPEPDRSDILLVHRGLGAILDEVVDAFRERIKSVMGQA